MPVKQDEKSWESTPLSTPSDCRADAQYPFPATPRDADHRPGLRVLAAGRLTVVEFVNAHALFEEEAVRELGDRLQRLVGEGHIRLVLDLSKVRYASSGVVALVAWLYRKINAAGGSLRLVGLDPVLFDAIRICRLDRVVEVDVDEAAALRNSHSTTN